MLYRRLALGILSAKTSIDKPFSQYRAESSNSAMGKLDGKVAVITASTDGIGFAIAAKLASEGASVVIGSRKKENVRQALLKFNKLGYENVAGVVCHVAKSQDRAAMFLEAANKFGGIDILVSNAAVNPTFGSILDCTNDIWDKIFEINVKCPFMLTKEVIPYLKERNGGTVIYISSIGGLQPFSMLGPYCVSKTALLGLTKVFAAELAPDNIRVNCVAPGVIKTKFSSALHENEAAHDLAVAQIPMGRIGKPAEVGGIVAFLCSEDASYITGENIVVAGGMQSRL